MKKTVEKLTSYRETIAEMFRLGLYVGDVAHMDGLSMRAAYAQILAMPYVGDPAGEETVSRPGFTLRPNWQGPRDCDDKSVIIIALANRRRIPSRLCVVGVTSGRPHHVYPELKIDGAWLPTDPTYPERNSWGQRLYAETFRRVFRPRFILPAA